MNYIIILHKTKTEEDIIYHLTDNNHRHHDMLLYKKIQNEKFIDVPVSSLSEKKGSFVLFLGGLEHINGMGAGQTLIRILEDLSVSSTSVSVPIYMPVHNIAKITNTEKNMFDFIKNGSVSPEAHALFEQFFLPASLRQQVLLSPDDERRELLSTHFRRFNILSYSYGTSLVQQVERLFDSHLKTEQPYSLVLAETLPNIGVINIGPVACPYDRNERRYGIEEKNMSAPNNLFTQLFFYKKNDKVMQDKIGNSLIPELQAPVTGFGNENVGFVCDFEGDEWLRRVGKGSYPSGKPFTRLDYSFNHEAHDLRAYTNKLSINGEMITYPSTPISDCLHDSALEMIKESQNTSNAPRKFPLKAIEYFKNPATQNSMILDFNNLRSEFNAVVAAYSRATPAEAFDIINDLMDKVQKRINRSKNPDYPGAR